MPRLSQGLHDQVGTDLEKERTRDSHDQGELKVQNPEGLNVRADSRLLVYKPNSLGAHKSQLGKHCLRDLLILTSLPSKQKKQKRQKKHKKHKTPQPQATYYYSTPQSI